MSVDKATNPCNKFQANIFNKSKCQNCFKSRELHLLTDYELEQAKPVYGGWLCLAPEGTDFDNPAQRSRKWQRRFFILYENGNLSFALDELTKHPPSGHGGHEHVHVGGRRPSRRTGQRNALRIATAQQDTLHQGERREMISGWWEQIAVIQQNNKHSCSRKHKVDHDPAQEACPAKMAATGSCRLEVEGAGGRLAEPGAEPGAGPLSSWEGGLSWTGEDMEPQGSDQPSSGNRLQCPPATCRGRSSSAGTGIKPASRWRGTASASPNRSRPGDKSGPRQKQEAMDLEPGYPTATDTKLEGDQSEFRMGRSNARVHKREKMQSCGDVSHIPVTQRRAKSLDRRTSESIMTPDLLNFKKGWMVKLEKEDQWKKYWFVLTADSLRYYKDSIAEEAFDLQGEIDLTKCYDVSEYHVLRNYGFQIHTRRGIYTLSAMTAGIRKNWIQALMKNVNHAHAPAAASYPGLHIPTEALPKPDVTQDSPSKVPTEGAPHLKDPAKVPQERRRDEGCKTHDRAEFRPLSESALELEIRRSREPCSPETLNQERRRRRQQRRKRYESILGFALSTETAGDVAEGGRESDPRGGTAGSQQILVEKEDMEKIWMQVERKAFRGERLVPLFTETAAEDTVELQKLMETYRQGVEDLRSRLEESDCRRLELEAQLRTAGFSNQEIGQTTDSGMVGDSMGTHDTGPLSSHAQNLRDMYLETRGLLQQQNAIRQSMQEQLGVSLSPLEHEGSPQVLQAPSIWLHDTDGHQQELGDFQHDFPSMPNTTASPLVSEDEEPLLRYEGALAESNVQTHLESAAYEPASSSDTYVNETAWSGMCKDEVHEQTLNLFESLCGQKELEGPELEMCQRMSKEVELLRSQNEALHQHNQEMLNQLTEADRELERLKVDVCHPPEMEQRSKARVVFLETELNARDQELLEAKSLIASLEQRLSEVESQALGTPALQVLDVPEDADESWVEVDDDTMADRGSRRYLLRCFEATEAKLIDLERKLHQSEQSCSELRLRNMESEEVARTCIRRTAEAEAEVARLSAELEKGKWREGQKIPDEEHFLQVSEGTETVSKGKSMEVIGRSDFRLVECEQEEPESTLISYLQWEEDKFWGTMLNRIKADSSQTTEGKLICVLLMEVTKHTLAERQLLLLAKDLLEAASRTSFGRARLVEIDDGTYSNGTGDLEGPTPEKEIWSDFTGTMDLNNQNFYEVKHIGNDFTESNQQKMYLLNYITLINTSSTSDKLKFMGQRLSKYYRPGHWLHTIHTTAPHARHCSLMGGKLNTTQQQGDLSSSPTCTNCASLARENGELQAKVSFLEKELEMASADTKTHSTNLCHADKESQTPTTWLHDTKANLQVLRDSNAEDASTLNGTTPTPVSDHRDHLLPNEPQSRELNEDHDMTTSSPMEGDRDDTVAGKWAEEQGADSLAVSKAEQELAIVDGIQTMVRLEDKGLSLQDHRESPNQEVGNIAMSNHHGDVGHDDEEEKEGAEQENDEEREEEGRVVRLRERVKELENQLRLVAEVLKAEHDGIVRGLRLQHEQDMERLKVACEQGLASMEDSQQRVLEGIQLRHQGELERLMTDRDQLLQEETAATVMAIESIKRAYQQQMDRQAEKTHQSKLLADNTHLQETHRQHREELEVLAQQYSLQRLENGHLGQALDAERTALGQCQQENQALRARNQELSGLLAAELSGLCSRSQQEASPLGQGGEAYQLEISLRVKESEIQCLRQQINSLKEELLHAHRDRSLAVQQNTESSAELSVMKARFQRDMDALQENLRLAHRALEQTIP